MYEYIACRVEYILFREEFSISDCADFLSLKLCTQSYFRRQYLCSYRLQLQSTENKWVCICLPCCFVDWLPHPLLQSKLNPLNVTPSIRAVDMDRNIQPPSDRPGILYYILVGRFITYLLWFCTFYVLWLSQRAMTWLLNVHSDVLDWYRKVHRIQICESYSLF